MATTFTDLDGNGQASRQFTFPSIKEADIKVEVDGVDYDNRSISGASVSATTFTINSYTTTGGGYVVFDTAPATSANKIRIYRDTDVDSPKATFTAGSSVKAGDLNNNQTQLLYAAQEEQNQTILTSDIKDGAVTTAKIQADNITSALIADDQINSEHYVDGSIDTAHIAADQITNALIADNQIDSEHYVDGSIDTAHIADAQITTAKIADGAITDAKIQGGSLDNRYYTETELDAGQLDNRYFTETESDARYFNISSGDTIKDGDTFPDNDTTIATTAAINDRIIDLVDDVGGFVPIANETSFPTSNPDVNNGAGTIVSVSAASTNLAPSGTTVTIANGRGSGLAVIITGVSATIPSGFGFLVETTTTAHTYTFHRLSPKATEVTTVAGISSNVTTVAGISSNVTAVATNNANVTTVAGSIANVNTTAGSISNVNSVATNMANVNNFADKYQVASSNPSTDGGGNALAAGDLYFDTTADELKVYNGSAWQGGVTASGNFAATTGSTFTGHTIHNDNVKANFGTGSDLEIFHTGSNSIINDTGVGSLQLQNAGSTKIELPNSTNGNLKLTPNGTGAVEIQGDGSSSDGTLQLNCSQNSHGVKIKSPAHSAGASYTLTLPTAVGSSGQVLSAADGSGTLSFVTAEAGAKNNGTIFENLNEITTDYTITANSNGFSMGPMTITNSTVTVGSGETYTIL